jgi:pimeloyl-ACP methyl ester carboxylesterase
MPSARIGDIEVAYESCGYGPPLIAIMGLTGSRWHWRGFPERLADAHRVITFDNRGVGETSAPSGPYTTAQMAADTLALLDHLEIGQAIVFGVSMGGMIAQELALAAPGRVGKLILGCTSFGGPTAVAATQEVSAAFGKIGNGATVATVRELIEANFSRAFGAQRPELIQTLLEHGLHHRMSALGFRGQLGAIRMHDAASRVGKITTPTLILTGDEDNLIPQANAMSLAEAMSNARLVTLAGSGHMFWIEAPEAAESAIRSFLTSQEAGE